MSRPKMKAIIVQLDQISVLELKASLFRLRSFSEALGNRHVKLKMDNTTAIAYIKKKLKKL